MALPRDNAEYKRQEYWEQRFAEEEEYDWIADFAAFRHLLLPELRPSDRILVVGCGNSPLSREVYDAGFHNIVNVDFSRVCIEKQRARHARERPEMKWQEMDMLQLEFAAESFDVVLDKCSMDALLVDEGDPWFPRAECVAAVARYLDGVARVLAPGGKFLQVSFGQPHFRRGYLTRAGLPWALEVKTFGEFFHYFFYKMQRRADAAPPKPEPEPEAAAPPPAALAQQQQQQQQPAQQLPSALVPPPDTP